MNKIKSKYFKSYYNSPFGTLTLICDEFENLVELRFEEQRYCSDVIDFVISENNNLNIFIETKAWLNEYFKGNKPKISKLSLRPNGNEFRHQVWKILCEIPYGQVTTYGAIAKQIAAQRGIPKMSAQAVGGAIAHNPIPIIIPCHRVIGTNGELTGYSGGINKKIKLLELEGFTDFH